MFDRFRVSDSRLLFILYLLARTVSTKKRDHLLHVNLRILAGGGSKNPKKLLLEHGVDIDSRKFWQGGFDYVGEQISKLQTLL